MIKAVADKIIVQFMRATKTKGGLILPDTVTDPQGYGKVLSVGEDVNNVEVGEFLVFHPRAGMDMLINKQILKVLKYDELYGKLEDQEIKDSLSPLTVGNPEQKLVQPVSNIIQ
jgi:co-chaperonin GroES (HSP10)